MHRNFLALSTTFVTTLIIAACSGGGGSGGGASKSLPDFTGPLSVPNATCGGSSCISKSGSLVSPMAVASNVAVLEVGEEIYSHFTGTIIPGVNGVLYQLEQAAAEKGLKTCAEIAGVNSSLDYPLGSGYTVDISAGDKQIPSSMENSSVTMSKKFIFSYNSTKFAEAQIHCSASQRTFYVRLMDASANIYEFWSQVDGNKRTLFGAMDKGSQKYTLFFKTADGTSFELHTVGNQIDYNGTTISFAVAGGANLTTGVADIAFATTSTVPTSLLAEDTNTNWDYVTPIRHCYNSVSTATVDSTGAACSSLLTAGPTIPVRTNSPSWSVSGMMSAPILTTF